MKKIVMAVMAMMAFTLMSVNAQRLVTISWEQATTNPQACGEYLLAHPSDTLVAINPEGNLCRKVFFNGTAELQFLDRKTTAPVAAAPASVEKSSEIQSIKIDKDTVEVSFKDGRVKNFDQMDSNEVSAEKQLAYLNGELFATNPEHKNLENKNRHKQNASLVGGGRYVDGGFSPYAGVRLGYESCHFLFELEGGVTTSKYTEVAQASGRYTSLNVQFNVGWKFWQDKAYRHYLALMGTVGAASTRSDSKEMEVSSQYYSTQFEGGVRFSYTLTKGWVLTADLGVGSYGKVRHDERQDLKNIGPFVKLGAGYSF